MGLGAPRAGAVWAVGSGREWHQGDVEGKIWVEDAALGVIGASKVFVGGKPKRAGGVRFADDPQPSQPGTPAAAAAAEPEPLRLPAIPGATPPPADARVASPPDGRPPSSQTSDGNQRKKKAPTQAQLLGLRL